MPAETIRFEPNIPVRLNRFDMMERLSAAMRQCKRCRETLQGVYDTLARKADLALCANCGREFKPSRKPRGNLSFCKRCGKKASSKFAQRRYRQRQEAK